jgi:hypothetical protein
LESIKKTLEEIDELHRAYLGEGSLRARDEFYAKRAALFLTLEGKLEKWLRSDQVCVTGVRSRGCWKYPPKAMCIQGKLLGMQIK